MTKIVIALQAGTDLAPLLDEALRTSLADAGATRVQVNLPDPAFDGALRLAELDPPVVAALSLWCEESRDGVLAVALAALGTDGVHAWSVEETEPLTTPHPGDGVRYAAMANLAFLRVPDEMAYDEWRDYWQGTHTQVAIDTQATFGYVQNRVLAPLTADAPPVAAIVEELFPEDAATDLHAFYGSGGDRAELKRRLDAMLASVARFGADQHLDLVSTARYRWQLA